MNLGIATWSVIAIASIGFIVMFGISSLFGDFQRIFSSTLENDSKSRNNRLRKKDIK